MLQNGTSCAWNHIFNTQKQGTPGQARNVLSLWHTHTSVLPCQTLPRCKRLELQQTNEKSSKTNGGIRDSSDLSSGVLALSRLFCEQYNTSVAGHAFPAGSKLPLWSCMCSLDPGRVCHDHPMTGDAQLASAGGSAEECSRGMI